jgi:starvation-inducible DNA-binding protein
MPKASVALQPKTRDIDIDTGLDDAYRAEMAEDLSAVLAATYKLTIKSQLYHWNVVGPLFKSLHELTEEHYQTLFEATDIIAERIRALGHLAPIDLGRAMAFAPDSSDIAEPTAEDMINDLILDHSAAVRAIRSAARIADSAGDFTTTDMLTARSAFHEKALWMLRAIVTT